MADRKPDLALQQFQKIAALDPDNPAIKTQIGLSQIDAGQREQGLSALEQVFSTEAGAQIAGPSLVVTELRARQFDRAAEVAASLVKLDPKNPIYHTLLGRSASPNRIIPGRKRVSSGLGNQSGLYRCHTRSGASFRGNE